MKKIKKVNFNKVAALAIIVSVSGSGSPAYAVTLSSNKSSNNKLSNSQHYKGSNNIKKKLDRLVVLESINQFQESTILKYLATYKEPLKNTNIGRLSTSGTISKTQETIISNLFITYKNSISKAINSDFESKLIKLVDLETITQDQKCAIINLYTISKSKSDEAIALDDLVAKKTITKAEKIIISSTFMNSKKLTIKTINDILLSKLDKLILDGTINEDQRAAVIKLVRIDAIDSQKVELHRRLDTLVTVGTITKDNEANIINALLIDTN